MVEVLQAPLTTWMYNQIGPGRMFASESAWARRAGLSTSTFNAILQRGSADVANLTKIARAAERNPLDLFEMAQLISGQEVADLIGRQGAVRLNGLDREALEILHSVPEGEARRVFLVNMRALAEAARSLIPQGTNRPRTPRRAAS